MGAMLLAVILVTLATFALIRGQVAAHFTEAYTRQFERQFEQIQQSQADRLRGVASEIGNNTSNPRLMAALLEDDYSRFYSDLAEELEPFYQNADQIYSSAQVWPFFRFISADGQYLEPPRGSSIASDRLVANIPGIMSPLAESQLKSMLSPLRTSMDDDFQPRSGFLVGDVKGERYLLKGFVCPLVNAFGEFLGDLVFVLPWGGNGQMASEVDFLVAVDGGLFGSDGRPLPTFWDASDEASDVDLSVDRQQRVVVEGMPHLLFNTLMTTDTGFPAARQITLFSLREQVELQASITRVLVLLAIGGIVFSLFLSMGLANSLSRPIARLRNAAAQIGRGEFDTRVEVRTRDELEQLGASFNEMAEGLSLKERYKSVLSKVADSQVADRLMRGDLDMRGELVEATVMFCDIRGFTAMSEGMDPHKLIAILNEHMTAMTEVVYEFGGVVDKYVGDELMVIFGAPLRHEDDVERAYACGQKMLQRCKEMNANRERALTIGIGMAHGTMVAGCMGSDTRLNYTVLGDRVNLAARLCSQAGGMEVVVDEAIRERLGATLEGATQRTLPLKGFATSPPFYVMKN